MVDDIGFTLSESIELRDLNSQDRHNYQKNRNFNGSTAFILFFFQIVKGGV